MGNFGSKEDSANDINTCDDGSNTPETPLDKDENKIDNRGSCMCAGITVNDDDDDFHVKAGAAIVHHGSTTVSHIGKGMASSIKKVARKIKIKEAVIETNDTIWSAFIEKDRSKA